MHTIMYTFEKLARSSLVFLQMMCDRSFSLAKIITPVLVSGGTWSFCFCNDIEGRLRLNTSSNALIFSYIILSMQCVLAFDSGVFTTASCRVQCVAKSRSVWVFYECTCLTSIEILTLLCFCLNVTYLALWRDIYKQSFGSAMGSPISVTMAT